MGNNNEQKPASPEPMQVHIHDARDVTVNLHSKPTSFTWWEFLVRLIKPFFMRTKR